MAKYVRSYTSGGKQISTANQVVDFVADTYPNTNCNVQFLNFQTFSQPCHIKLNDETTVHFIDTNSEFILEDIHVDKFTIVDAGVEYYYTAFRYV